MARNAVALFSFVFAIICLLQVATAFNLGEAIVKKAEQLIQSENLNCGSYSAFCNAKDANSNVVSREICKAVIGIVLGC